MKNNMYRRGLAAGVLLTVTAATVFGGCGKEQAQTEGKAPQDDTQSEAAESAAGTEEAKADAVQTDGEPVTLRFASWQSNHAEANQAVADAYHEQNPNVTVEFEYIGDMNASEYETKVDVMIMGGEPLDIVMTASIMEHTVRAASNEYLSLDSFFEAEGTKAEDEYNIIVRVDDQVYGIPGEMKYDMVLINQDMLEAAGLLVPDLDWTWEDYREYAIQMTEGSGADKIYGSFFRTGSNVFGMNSAKKGNPYFNDDGSLAFDNPGFSDFLALRYQLESVDGASVSLEEIKSLNLNYRDQFFSGKVAMMPLGTYVLSDIGNEKYEHDFTTTFARIPSWTADAEHLNKAEGNVFSIARTSEHPKEAYDFLKFWCTEGVKIKGMFLSNEKGADKMDSVHSIIANFEDKLDVETLSAIMQDEAWVDSYSEFCPSYQNEIDSLLTEESDQYLLGTQSLEETMENLTRRGNEIIEANQ